ncbi:hypothetical protein BFC17_05695 [Alteromonas lipolytica]|uniref:Uncharacterized protein n=2 Tax=Alteromonas lipolytica TaxID=1856405 RepID=A0A1E8F9R7_9ALTE|nr:hypothetical protein BFC17_05695 [Alteromonas lipolytica]
MLILLPLSGQANTVRVMDTKSVNSMPAMQSSQSDCPMHHANDNSDTLPMVHASQSVENAHQADCCQDDNNSHCAHQGSSCSQSGCQCDHVSTHLVTYLTGTDTPITVKVTSGEISGRPALAFAGFTSSLLRPPTHLL